MFAYRPEIDGLRAVAVLAVALFHAEIAPFSGGFVGVDVFFVISGYLITKIIWNDLAAERFSYIHFFERRIRRILPALAAVTFFVILFVFLFYTPREARAFGESVSFLGLLASNHYFLQERGYFAAPSESFVLLHTWSLAVEEQFYLVFPALLALLVAWARRRVVFVVATLALASLIAAEGALSTDSGLAFYAAPFRVWELMLGSLLALGAAPTPVRPAVREGAAALGLALIAVAVFAYDSETRFPGLAALPPCLGAALVIWASGESDRYGAPAAARALAWPPMVFVGLASYSFYLWHWPALSLAKYYKITPLTAIEAALVLVVSFGVAVLSLRYVERPFRRPNGVLARPALFVACAASLGVMIGVGVVLQETKGLPQRLPEAVARMTTGDAIEFGVELDRCASQHHRLSPEAKEAIFVMFCEVGGRDAAATTILWGDSHALSIAPAFEAASERAGRDVLVTSRAACPPIIGFDFTPTETWEGCTRHNAQVMASLPALGIERALLFAAWDGYTRFTPRDLADGDGPEYFERQLRATVAALQAQGVEVVIGTSVPTYTGFDVPSVMSRSALLGRDNPIDASRAAYDASQSVVRDVFDRISAETGVGVFELHARLCDAQRCAYQRDGVPLYADHGHINVIAARAMADAVAPLLR